ncbi:MAG: MMPL family transporter [Planctomycetes bacterium]|nr:MMPL family transporter [Planctomycetota bacterium]
MFFDHLGRFVARRWAWVLGAWVVAVTIIKVFAPPWAKISQDDDIKSFPPHYNSVVGHDLLEKAFPGDLFNSQVVVAVERTDGALSEADQEFLKTLTARLNSVQEGGLLRNVDGDIEEDKYGLGIFLTPSTPVIGQLLTSADKKAALLVAPCQHTFIAEKIKGTVLALRKEIDGMTKRGEVPPGLRIAATGSAGVGADLQISSDESLERSLWVTILLVVAILLLVYRSPVVAMIPLVTISVSIVTAMSIMALLTLVNWGGFHFQVMKITDIFVIVVLFGAGTDYCLFLIARYREELEQGADRETAVQMAVSHVGGALAASAATVIIGLGMMVFAEFGKFRYTGPAVAISLAVALVGSLTLTPALVRLLGPIVFWPCHTRRVNRSSELVDASNDSHPSFQERFWAGVSRWLVRRPAAIWASSVLVLTPFAFWGTQLIPTYDFLAELSDRCGSKVGSMIIQQHFPKGMLGPLTVLLKTRDDAEHDLRKPEARKDIAALTKQIREIPGVAQIRSLTSPVGQPITDEPAEPAPAQGAGGLGGIFKAITQVSKPFDDLRRKKEAEHYVSAAADGQVTRLDVVLDVPPFSSESMELRDTIDRRLKVFTSQPGTMLTGASHSFAGITSSTYDLRKITQSDQRVINTLVVGGVFMVLVVLLRRPGICLYLMATVLLGYFATLGMTEGFFKLLHYWLHPDEAWLGLDWKVAFFLFIILVAVGEDYNILLMSRVMEEQRKLGVIEGVRTAVARTGGIITSCGIIMAGTFGSMSTGTLAAIIQLGFALALGVLLDTFVVRPVLVPAFLLLMHRRRFRHVAACVPGGPHIGARAEVPVESTVPQDPVELLNR